MRGKSVLFASAVMVAACCAAPVLAAEPFASSEEFGSWMTQYYLKPEPAKVAPALAYFCDTLGGVKMNSRMAVAAFFAGVFKKDPKPMQEAYRQATASGSEEMKIFLSNAIWLTDTAQAKGLLQTAAREWGSATLREILEKEIAAPPNDLLTAALSPPILDMMWATFSATGDPAPVQRVIQAAVTREKAQGGQIATAEAAIWSLGSNVKQHEKVRAICQEEFAKSGGSARDILGKILDGTWADQAGSSTS